MPRHRPEGEPEPEPVQVEVVEEPQTRGQRLRGWTRRAALLVLFALLLIVLFTLVAEVRYGRGLLQEQIEQGRDGARDRAALLDRIEEQTDRIDALTAQLAELGVEPVGSLDPPPDTPTGPPAGETPAPEGAPPEGSEPEDGTGSEPGPSPGEQPQPQPGAEPQPQPEPEPRPSASPAPPAPQPDPEPEPEVPEPCLIGVPGQPCAVPLPGFGRT